MSTTHEPTDNEDDEDDDVVVIGSYQDGDTVVFYDTDNPAAWLQIDDEQVFDLDSEVLK